MAQQGLDIGICGGGIGGLCAAIICLEHGHEVTVYEQAESFQRIGADVNLTPNAVKCLDGLGVGAAIRATAAQPQQRLSRTWDTGAVTSRLPMGDSAEETYGAPQLTIHRGDLLQALEKRIPEERFAMGRKAESLDVSGARAQLTFASQQTAEHDLVVGADGIHSAVRRSLFGADQPEFTGLVSYRAVISRAAVDLPNLDSFTKWWGPSSDMQVVVFPLTRGEEVFVFATTAQEGWYEESWTMPGDVDELRDIYKDFHPEVRDLLAACESVTKSALYVREPMASWHTGSGVILGDAAHPMVPFMAQGACMAIEDAVVFGRALASVTDAAAMEPALCAFEQARMQRTADIQRNSRGNEWLKDSGNADWVYGYDAWTVPLS